MNGQISVDEFVRRVAEYVRNNIDVELRFGVGKGARGAIMDQSGTPFDQAQLMVELLKRGNVTRQLQSRQNHIERATVRAMDRHW